MSADKSVQTVGQLDSRGEPIVSDLLRMVENREVFTVAGPSWGMLIDVSNGGGKYKHTGGTAIRVVAGTSAARKEKSNDQWEFRIGAILRIDGTNADVGFIEQGTA